MYSPYPIGSIDLLLSCSCQFGLSPLRAPLGSQAELAEQTNGDGRQISHYETAKSHPAPSPASSHNRPEAEAPEVFRYEAEVMAATAVDHQCGAIVSG